MKRIECMELVYPDRVEISDKDVRVLVDLFDGTKGIDVTDLFQQRYVTERPVRRWNAGEFMEYLEGVL